MRTLNLTSLILYISIFFSSEYRCIFQGNDSFNSVMFFLSFTSDNKPYRESLPSVDNYISPVFLSAKDYLTIRNKIKDLLEEDAYDE